MGTWCVRDRNEVVINRWLGRIAKMERAIWCAEKLSTPLSNGTPFPGALVFSCSATDVRGNALIISDTGSWGFCGQTEIVGTESSKLGANWKYPAAPAKVSALDCDCEGSDIGVVRKVVRADWSKDDDVPRVAETCTGCLDCTPQVLQT